DVSEIVAIDQVAAEPPVPGVRAVIGDISDEGFLTRAIEPDVTSVFHLAAVVSAAAEADFDLGMRVNIDATRAVLERCRALAEPPKLVFTSSLAAFGDPPAMVLDDTPALPKSSYGVQKVIGEYLIGEYARKGFVDARAVRLPTITIRPGKPNKAASSFVSSILREPLQGQRAICPVAPEMQLWVQSPRVAIHNLLRAHDLSADEWAGPSRVVNLPGLTVTVAEMIEALTRAGGDAGLVEWQPDAAIRRLVGSWPVAMNTARADAMGFHKDTDIDGIIAGFIGQL
ncbi:Nucleoside-diphosphate-sugar epimerases, partial [hydrothermal vent metagenome]